VPAVNLTYECFRLEDLKAHFVCLRLRDNHVLCELNLEGYRCVRNASDVPAVCISFFIFEEEFLVSRDQLKFEIVLTLVCAVPKAHVLQTGQVKRHAEFKNEASAH
jgi:hypothetical protein